MDQGQRGDLKGLDTSGIQTSDERPTPAQLRQRRRELGLSQNALAHALGVSANTVARWERGECSIGHPNTLRLALEHLEGNGGALPYVHQFRNSQLTHRGSPSFALLPSSGAARRAAPRHNLIESPTPLIGREGELDAVLQRLLAPEVRLLTLTGPGGSGKTRVALAAARLFLASFADGVFFVDLSPVREPHLVVSAIARVLGVRDAGQRPLVESLLRYLQNRRLLLVLDNFEQVLEAAVLVADILTSAPSLKVLVTSREPLRLRWEQIFLVPPLAVPDPRHLPGQQVLAILPSLVLFAERTRALVPNFVLTAENAESVAVICAGLDGLPLAIELAAARARHLSPAAMAARLGPRLELLKSGARDVPQRHHSLRDAIAWSYELLTPAEQALYRQLGVFMGGWTLEAAARVGGVETDLCLDLLEALHDKSLLRQEPEVDHEPRFSMLETIREYAVEQLEISGELDMIRERHTRYYLGLAEAAAAEFHGPGLVAALDRLELEHDNLRAALRWALDRRDAETALRMGAALWEFWWIRCYLQEGLEWLEAGLALDMDVPAAVLARALNGAGVMISLQHVDLEQAFRVLAESVRVCREIGDAEYLSYPLTHQGVADLLRGNGTQTFALIEESLAVARQVGNQWGIGHALRYLGLVSRAQGDVERAKACAEQALLHFRALNDVRRTAYALMDLGDAAYSAGNGERATGLLQDALIQFREMREVFGGMWVLSALARVMGQLGERERSVRLFGATAALAEMIGTNFIPPGTGEHERSLAAV